MKQLSLSIAIYGAFLSLGLSSCKHTGANAPESSLAAAGPNDADLAEAKAIQAKFNSGGFNSELEEIKNAVQSFGNGDDSLALTAKEDKSWAGFLDCGQAETVNVGGVASVTGLQPCYEHPPGNRSYALTAVGLGATFAVAFSKNGPGYIYCTHGFPDKAERYYGLKAGIGILFTGTTLYFANARHLCYLFKADLGGQLDVSGSVIDLAPTL